MNTRPPTARVAPRPLPLLLVVHLAACAGSAGAGAPGAPPRFVAVMPLEKSEAPKSPALGALEAELARAMKALSGQDPKPYFIAYEVHDRAETQIEARAGALVRSDERRWRSLDTDVRVGDYRFDSTHPLRGREMGSFGSSAATLPIEDDPDALRAVAWQRTEQQYKAAAERFVELRTRRNVEVELDDKSDDFSRETPVTYLGTLAKIDVDRADWEKRVRALSARMRDAKDLLEGRVTFTASVHNRWLVNSEGALVQTGQPAARLGIYVRGRAPDGQDLRRFESFDAATPAGLASQAEMEKAVDQVIADLQALRAAPPAEPFTGPAILEGKAAAVFFHEIFGHRVEGHRQKDDREGQTFAKKVGEPIMPSFISVFDDPTLAKLGERDLNGFYRFDNEGVAARRAELVEAGVLKGFLLGRTPTRGFMQSNGHGRRQEGRRIVPRQANLVVQPSASVSKDELRARLRGEAQRQGKPYGLLFTEIEGGFTMTGRGGPQAFKVLPIMVYRVYSDGRPDELIRGADLVGTPLASLGKILAASDDYQIFNGHCGAESGFIPVSGVSPSLLVAELEVERKYKGQERPPVLPPPGLADGGGK